MEKHMQPDGAGGSITEWKDGMEFDAAVSHDTTILAQTAEAQNTASTYTLYIARTMELSFPDVIKRLDNGATFQITTDSADLITPESSTLNRRAVKARKWVLPG